MSIYINKDTKVITQGITGKTGQFHTLGCQAYANGKNAFVAGVNPKKAGEKFSDIPIYASVKEAATQTGATVSVIYVPPAGAADAIWEAVEADLDLVIAITEGIPVRDMLNVRNKMKAKEAAGGKRTLLLGDPYHCECHKTGRLLAEALQLPPEKYQLTFQSRFGRAEWLQPYTAPTLEELGRVGTNRVDVFCPGFPADCLETLEEIAMEGLSTFRVAGGKDFHYIPCLNDNEAWIAGIADIALAHLQGWPLTLTHPHVLEASRTRAQSKGAAA
mgnify:CR=1 FL=1